MLVLQGLAEARQRLELLSKNPDAYKNEIKNLKVNKLKKEEQEVTRIEHEIQNVYQQF